MLLFFCATTASAEEFNAGIVQGLWYSQEDIFAGDTVRIYVAIRNNTGSDLTGTIEFKDGEKRIDRKNVEALDGRIIESWADWTPSYGTHTISASLSRIALHTVGSSTQEAAVTSALAEETFFVDYDTDGDSIGNEDDSDDDGDGVSDTEEKKNGTDPLRKNKQEESDEEDTEVTKEDDEDKQDENADAVSGDEPLGLERYLTESPAENMLSGVTTFINDAKDDLDAYRAQRTEKRKAGTTTPEVNEDGFGAITRSTSTQGSAYKDWSLTDFFGSVFNLAKALFDVGYTSILAALSFILSHPILVQLGVLVLILFVILKFALHGMHQDHPSHH